MEEVRPLDRVTRGGQVYVLGAMRDWRPPERDGTTTSA